MESHSKSMAGAMGSSDMIDASKFSNVRLFSEMEESKSAVVMGHGPNNIFNRYALEETKTAGMEGEEGGHGNGNQNKAFVRDKHGLFDEVDPEELQLQTDLARFHQIAASSQSNHKKAHEGDRGRHRRSRGYDSDANGSPNSETHHHHHRSRHSQNEDRAGRRKKEI